MFFAGRTETTYYHVFNQTLPLRYGIAKRLEPLYSSVPHGVYIDTQHMFFSTASQDYFLKTGAIAHIFRMFRAESGYSKDFPNTIGGAIYGRTIVFNFAGIIQSKQSL